MKKTLQPALAAACLVALLLSSSLCVHAAGTAENPFDLSKYSKQIEELGVPTVKSVADLEGQATKLFEAGNYEKAEPALDEWAREANWLSNLVSAGVAPFYGASYDDRQGIGRSQLDSLIPLERCANDLKGQRNHAMIMRAECLVKLGRTKDAVATYAKALDLLPISDWDWWVRAANGLYTIIGSERISN